MNKKQWGSCYLTQWKSPIHFVSFTLLVPLLKPWTNYDDSDCVHLIDHPDIQSEQYVKRLYCQLVFLSPYYPSGRSIFFLFASLSWNFVWIFFFSHSIIIIHPVKRITTILSPLTLIFLHVGKITYLSEDKTIANVLSFMCYCIWAYRKERL